MKSEVYVELDIDYCSLTYGVNPCTAEVGVTGEAKCFNTLKTCQDTANFDNDPVTLRFARMDAAYRSPSIEAIPAIVSVQYTPAIISLGQDMGERASISITFDDAPHSDVGPGFDKYWDERGYDPRTKGTLWGRFRTRQPFVRGRPLRYIRGEVGQSLAEMETRLFLIDSVDGPHADGTFTVTAKDALKQLDGERAQAPVASNGRLSASITDTATSATLAPVGIGAIEYPASGYINIGGKEIVGFTRTDDDLTITRGEYNTEGVAHDDGERCQLCLEYLAEDPADILSDLMENYASVDSALIPLADWQAETAAYYQRVNTALIADPVPVRDLVNELIEQVGLAVWWSDTQQVIRLQVLRAITTEARVYSEETNIVEGSLRSEEQPSRRISQVWTYFAQTNPLRGIREIDNFRSAALDVSTIEADYGTPSIKRIFSRWIPFGGLAVATRVNQIQIGRFQTPPRRITFKVARRAEETAPLPGEGCRISGLPMQEADGDLESVPAQIIRVRPNDGDYDVTSEEMLFEALDAASLITRTITIDQSVNNFNLVDAHNALYPAAEEAPQGAWSAGTYNQDDIVSHLGSFWVCTPASTTEEPGDAATDWDLNLRVVCRIDEGVIVGSDSTGNPAFVAAEAGDWPAGLVPRITGQGRVQGRGGLGGDGMWNKGGGQTDIPATPGEDGGTALLTEQAIEITSADLEFWAGGGGGGGGGAAAQFFYDNGGCGGGGGAGTNPGLGGDGKFGQDDGEPGTSEAGGAGGTGSGSNNGDGGDGGDPGEAGTDGERSSGEDGGAAGAAIDGDSLVTHTAAADIKGGQIN